MTCADDIMEVSLLEFGSLGVALGQGSDALVQNPVTYPSKCLALAMTAWLTWRHNAALRLPGSKRSQDGHFFWEMSRSCLYIVVAQGEVVGWD